jgi:prepilin-type processing-associated H-X9-DG protein
MINESDRPRNPMGAAHEIVALLGIALVLAAILMPAFRHARAASPLTICMTNMHDLGEALTTYAEDWDDHYPMNRFPDATHPGTCCGSTGTGESGLEGSSYNWKRALIAGGYVKSLSVFACPANFYRWSPSDENHCAGDESNCVGPNKGVPDRQIPDSYAYNGAFFNEEFGARSLQDVQSPAHLILLLESRTGFPDLGDWAASLVFIHPGRRANWLMADGSVKPLKLIETIEPLYLWVNPDNPQRQFTVASIPQRLR